MLWNSAATENPALCWLTFKLADRIFYPISHWTLISIIHSMRGDLEQHACKLALTKKLTRIIPPQWTAMVKHVKANNHFLWVLSRTGKSGTIELAQPIKNLAKLPITVLKHVVSFLTIKTEHFAVLYVFVTNYNVIHTVWIWLDLLEWLCAMTISKNNDVIMQARNKPVCCNFWWRRAVETRV